MDKTLIEDMQFAVKIYKEVQKQRIALENRLRTKEERGELLLEKSKKLFKDMTLVETRTKQALDEMLKFHPLEEHFFSYIRGIGEVYGATLIAQIGDIGKFKTVSALWSYAGFVAEYYEAKCAEGHKMMFSNPLHHTNCNVLKDFEGNKCGAQVTVTAHIQGKAPKRRAGWHYFFKTALKTTCWNIAGNFIKQNPAYKAIYDAEKARQMREHPDLKPLLGHAHNRAIRKMMKIFLAQLWEAWRLAEGYEIRPPYVIDKLKHESYLSWAEMKGYLAEVRYAAKEAAEGKTVEEQPKKKRGRKPAKESVAAAA